MTELVTSSRWQFDRLKWSTTGVTNGVWGEEPNGLDDIPCARVADFDRVKLVVSGQLPTLRAVAQRERANRVLRRGDLLIEKSGGGDNQPVGCVVSYDGDDKAVCSNFIGRMPPAPEMHPRYWAYVHAWIYSTRQNVVAIKQTTGIQNLDIEAYLDIRVPYPSTDEQAAIAKFLDLETGRVDSLVAAKQLVLDLLAEKRKAIIATAVTRGLDPSVQLTLTGVEWMPNAPRNWRFSRIGRLFRQSKTLGFPDLTILSVYREFGVIERASRDDNANVIPDDLAKYQLVEAGDLVVNKMKAWQGSLGVSALRGITSPDYVVFRPTNNEDGEFLHFLLRTQQLTTVYLSISNGIRINQWRIEPERFAGIPVFLPSVKEQRSIVQHITREISKLDAVRAATERTIALLKERRAALIAAAVTGQLDVGAAA